MMKLVCSAALALSVLAAPAAFAQGNDAAGAKIEWTQGDKDFYGANAALFGPFFTDDTMMTPRSQEEIDAAWAAMDQPNQAALIAACSGVSAEGGKYSAFTTELCAKMGG